MIHKQEIERHQQQSSHDPTSGIKMEQPRQSSMEFKYSPSQCLEAGQKMDVANGNSGNVADEYMQQQNQFLMDSEGNSQQLPASGHIGIATEAFNQAGIKSEPMDYEQSNTNDSNTKTFTSTSVSKSRLSDYDSTRREGVLIHSIHVCFLI